MVLNAWTIRALIELGARLHDSKAGVICRAVREMKERSDREVDALKPWKPWKPWTGSKMAAA